MVRRPKAEPLTYRHLISALDYDADTGLFRWKYRPERCDSWNTKWPGKIAGQRRKDRHILIAIDYKPYLAHRLAWFYFFGDWPQGHLDHINGNHLDNRIENLRVATKAQNMANMKWRDAKALPKGVSRDRENFCARICVGRKKLYLGNFENVSDAFYAYALAARSKFGRFARF